MDNTKVCSKCHSELTIDNFYRSKTGKLGFSAACKVCTIKANKEYSATPQGKATAKRATRKYLHSDKGKAKSKQWNIKYEQSPNGKIVRSIYNHSDIGKGRGKRWRDKPLSKELRHAQYLKYIETEQGRLIREAALNRYKKSPKGKATAAKLNYLWHKRLKASICTLTAQEWSAIKARYKHKCVYCGEKKELEMDHIIPVSKGGNHVKENIVPACRSCNARKRDSVVLLQLLVI